MRGRVVGDDAVFGENLEEPGELLGGDLELRGELVHSVPRAVSYGLEEVFDAQAAQDLLCVEGVLITRGTCGSANGGSDFWVLREGSSRFMV